MYEDKTPEAIKAEILAAIRQSQGLSAMAGGFADGVAGPVAEQLSEAYRALEGVTSMLFVDESSGGYIDLVGGQYYNITRREGTRAYCDISFSGTPGLVIPKGTAFLTAGGLSYALMAAVALGPEGTGRGRLEAAEAGSAYNVEAGARLCGCLLYTSPGRTPLPRGHRRHRRGGGLAGVSGGRLGNPRGAGGGAGGHRPVRIYQGHREGPAGRRGDAGARWQGAR